MIVTAPVELLIVNALASVPVRLYVTVPPAGSVAAAVYTVVPAVAPSVTLPVDPELIVGATFVTVIATACVVVAVPSEAGTVMS